MASQNAPDPPYKPGTIRRIRLQNFMCHENFELQFGPNVNFVIGPNGSGKSAILTGLITALGGRATTTNRAKKMSEFIKYGKTQAKITVVLHNYDKIMEKEAAFKPDDYGKFIIVEKYISKDDASKLNLKNDRDKKVSERKQELDEMLEHFGILINNPICILNQEVSKTFLHSKRPEDKFDLFMKATNLEQIEHDYAAAQLSHKEWEGCNNRNSFAFKQLDSEYNACREKTVFLENRAKINDLRADLNNEYIWAIIRDNEKVCDGLANKIRTIDKDVKDMKKQIEDREDKLKRYDAEVVSLEEDLICSNERLTSAKKKFTDVRAEETNIKTKQVNVRSEIERFKRKILKYEEDKINLEKSISAIKQQMKEHNELNQDSERWKIELENIEKELPEDEAREKSLRLHTKQLSESMTAIRADLNGASMRVNELRNKMSQSTALLRRLKNGQENAIRKYGDFVIRIRDEIDRAHSQGKFKRKPLGPLGYLIKLKSQDIAGPLEAHLGRTAHAFVCDNHQDMNVLNGIFKKISSNSHDFRQPILITRPFGARHDVMRFKAQHDIYKTFLDYLDIEVDAVYNALVDRNALESVLFIPDYHAAENIMIDSRLIPKNTRMAYTKDCSVMHPRTSRGGYRCFAPQQTNFMLFSDSNSGQIREVEREIQLIEAELRDAEHIVKGFQDSLSVQRKEYDQNNLEIQKIISSMRKKENKMLELKTSLAAEDSSPQELSTFEAELENIAALIAQEKVSLEGRKTDLEALDRELSSNSVEKSECQSMLDLHENKKRSINKMIETTKNNSKSTDALIRKNKSLIESLTSQKDSEEKELERVLEALARSKQNISDETRPIQIRATDMLKEELRKIEAQLRVEQEEMQDPEEMMISLRKRMKEIENLTSLKESNQHNFSMASKNLDQRREGLLSLRTNTIGSVSTTFTSVMRPMGMNGQLQIYLDDLTVNGHVVKKAKTLEMRIDTNYTPSQRPIGSVMSDANSNETITNRRVSRSQPPVTISGNNYGPSAQRRLRLDQNGNGRAYSEKENTTANESVSAAEQIKMTDARSLSGGERSFSTVAFVLALWHHCASPFKLMDEIDVFMDMVTRRISYNTLIRFAQADENSGQFIFFSPLELPKIDNSGSCVRVFEMPAIVRKRPLSQLTGSEPALAGGDE